MELPPVDLLKSAGNYDLIKFGFDFESSSKLTLKKSREIKSSLIGIGYETLDRDTFEPKKTYQSMAASGVKWARLQTGWNKCEKQKGIYNFCWLDEIVDNLLAIGINPWFSVSFGNALYTPADDHRMEYVGEVFLYFGREAITGWENYVSALAEHFKGRITHWEIWNEPNTSSFWRDAKVRSGNGENDLENINQKAADYAQMVKITSCLIKKIIPEAKIIGGALSAGINVNTYVRALLKNHLADHIDILSYHPYGLVPEMSAEARFNFLRRELDKTGKKIPIWQGECGRPTGFINNRTAVNCSEYSQAKFLTRRIITDLRLGCEMSSYFMVADLKNYFYSQTLFPYGIISGEDYRPKAAYYALQSMASLFDNHTVIDQELYMRIYPANAYMNSYLPFHMVTAAFRRKGIPIFCYYTPELPDLDWEPRRFELCIDLADSEIFNNPVLVDPITQIVYRLNKSAFKMWAGLLHINPLPFMDYPLFFTDEKALED